MRQKTPFRLTAALVVAAITGLAITAIPVSAADPVAAPCANVEAVFARGSGQGQNAAERARFVNQIDARITQPLTANHYELGSVSIDGNSYPAVPVGTG